MRDSRYEASPSDGREILRIQESSAAKGSIQLIYTRRPDAYDSYMKESGEARVFIAKDGERAVGTCAEIIREVYLGGEVCRAAYICGLKKDAAYDGGVGFGGRLIRDFQRDDIDFYFFSVVAENTAVRRMFEKSHRLISMKPLVGYRTYIVSPKVKIKASKHSLTFRRATEEDTDRLMDFLRTEGKKKDMFPVVSSLDEYHNLHIEDFYLLIDGESMVAAAALWNQTEYKQYVVKRYGPLMKSARIFNRLLSALRYIQLPKENQPLDFPMLAFFLCKADSEVYGRIFLREIKEEIAKDYGMFVMGLPDGHFARPIMDGIPSISFKTELYEIKFPWSEQTYRTPDTHSAYFECGLL